MAKSTAKTETQGKKTTKETPVKAKKRYVFPRQNEIECPECKLHETVATSTQGKIQWRQCTRAIPPCSHPSFKVIGEELKVTDCKKTT